LRNSSYATLQPISETVHDSDKVTTEHQYELINIRFIEWCHFQLPRMIPIPNPGFKITVLFKGKCLKTVHLRDKVTTRKLTEGHWQAIRLYHFDDLEWPLARISWSQYSSKSNISKRYKIVL